MQSYFGEVWLVRLLVQRSLAAIYLTAFVSALNQFKALLGERGLLPVSQFLKRARFKDTPSVFTWRYSDRLLTALLWVAIVLSAAAVAGISEAGPYLLSVGTWLVLWVIYLSIVNVGQTF